MTTEAPLEGVLAAATPRFSTDDATAIAEQTFGVRAADARDLGSERDQTFLLLDGADRSLAVMKLSNAAEDPVTLDMEASAVQHAHRVDPGLPLALPWPLPHDPDSFRATIERGEGHHFIRMYDVLPGRGRTDPRELSDAALGAWGETTAGLARALRGFFHPGAHRAILWDVQYAAGARSLMAAIPDAEQRRLVGLVLDRFDTVVAPVWPSLRAQVVHTDLTVDNAMVDDAGRITGIVDFGDMSHSALVTDLASVLDSLVVDRGPDELFRTSRLILDGYERMTPLEPVELRLMGELLATRAAVTIAISSWRAERGLEDPGFGLRYNASVATTIATLLELGWDEVARRFGADVPRTPAGRIPELAVRRDRALGPALEALTYEAPILMDHASGVWMTDASGRTYLDLYNNVPVVGHAHPRVTEAVARQARRLNTNMRYLHERAIELGERLVATCPPGLDTVMFVNSGSEANDLAWRLATTFTGNRGGLCTAFAYHGISEAIASLSPESWPAGKPPEHVETWAPPEAYRARNLDAGPFSAALERLGERGLAPAAAIMDGVLTSDGFADLDPAHVRELVDMTHAAGGLWIADEVQAGHGRTGQAMWSFQRFGIVPDVVTLGKPMGNGHPVAAVITRREIAQRFADDTVFFSTFGGNPVSVAAALAVLDVLDDERVLPRVVAAGEALRSAARSVAAGNPSIGDVRGVGLAIGIEIVEPDGSRRPDPTRAAAIKEGLRQRGVLVGTTAAAGNVLKIRPPLAFTTAEVPLFSDAFAATLAALDG